MRLKRQEAKPNGSNQKVSFQLVVTIVIEEEQWQVAEFFITGKRQEIFQPLRFFKQPRRIFITVKAWFQLIILEEEVERPEVWTEGVAVSRAGDA